MKRGNEVIFGHDGIKEDFRKYSFWIFAFALFVLSYFILRPYLIALISAFILAFLIRPLDKKLEKIFGKKLAAFVSVVLVLIVFILPFALIFGTILRQAQNYFSEEGLKVLLGKISDAVYLSNLNIDLSLLANKSTEFLVSALTSGLGYLPSVLISFFITFVGIYYFLSNWNEFSLRLMQYLPFKDKGKIVKEVSNSTSSLVYGVFLIGIIEFFVAGIGFYLVGNRFYLLLGILVFIFAFIPALGPALVWGPVFLFYLIEGFYVKSGIVLFIGIILTLGIDILLKTKILGNRTKVNPLIMLLGIFGGITLFGIFGFVIGPLILIYAIKILEEGLRD